MDARATTAEPQHSYPNSTTWTDPSATSADPNSIDTTTTATTAAETTATPYSLNDLAAFPNLAALQQAQHGFEGSLDGASPHHPSAGSQTPVAAQFPAAIDLLPLWFPQQSNIYYNQLLQYNKLVSPTRGGGLQSPPLPPVVSASHAQAGPRSRSSSKVSLKDNSAAKNSTIGGGHGSRSHHSPDKNRSVVTKRETPSIKMPSKHTTAQAQHAESAKASTGRTSNNSASSSQRSQAPSHSSSVPSTPHQRARQFSFESREPSPTENVNNHSPRSAYSETNSTLPSLRPLPPPRNGGCKYETSQVNSRRRIPYSIGNERLEKLSLGKLKGKLTEEEERKVATDMREVYDRLIPSEAVEEKRLKLVTKLEKIFNDEWPGHDIQAHLFGSSGNLLCSDDSDVDICITTPWQELEGVCMIADLLARRGMEKVVCISAAKVPIVKIWDPELGLACDMNVNNTLALENTRMIRVYVETDPRIRQLAMIIKYWTRKRVVNDAAFGGTLSSYTWICLIVAFLQLRTPSILPALHQLPYKTQKGDGTQSDFADNLKKLKGYGKANKSSEADLLFQFFRFYAHEFDYDKYVLSVRLGRLLTKTDKKWHYAINNQLCVEEPFNTSRNLGNTVDEYSFRGLHLELRRAFDLISAAKFEEACEQFVFPKEEERVWSRPPPQPRPVLLRSASQSQSARGGRGGHRGGRNNYHRGGNGGNGGSNRRASSSVPSYDPNMFAPNVNMQQDLAWFQNAQFPYQYTPEFMAHMAFQQENMRHLQLFTQQSSYNQQQNMGHPLVPGSTNSGQNQPSDRTRTESFDNAPLSAPLRPELYSLYGMTLGQPFLTHAAASGYGTYPSSPVTTNGAAPDYRRSLQRSSGTTDKGVPASSSSLRSQSQPPARSQTTAQQAVGAGPLPLPGSQSSANIANLNARNLANGINSIPPEGQDEGAKPASFSPKSEEGKIVNNLADKGVSSKPPQPGPAANNGIAFGDLANQSSSRSPGRRRLSTDQLPQSILDRRMRRTSRSPSPLGHTRHLSTEPNLALLASSGSQARNSSRPLVVNGSSLRTSMSASSQQPGATVSPASERASDSSLENSLPQGYGPPKASYVGQMPTSQAPVPEQGASTRPPVVVNGSSSTTSPAQPALTDDSSFRDRIALMSSQYMNPHAIAQHPSFLGTDPNLAQAARQHLMSDQPNNAIAPLDLAVPNTSMYHPGAAEISLLSPVYESQNSSPVVPRGETGMPATSEKPRNGNAEAKKSAWTNTTSKQNQRVPNEQSQEPLENTKQPKAAKQTPTTSAPRPNGHVRGARSESDGGWQKASKGKKKMSTEPQSTHAELPPKKASERKGG